MKKFFSLLTLALLTTSVWAANTYVKVTSTDQLVAGKKYIVVNEEKSYAMGAISTGNTKFGVAISVDVSNGAVDIEGTAVAELTLGGQAGAYTFDMGNGAYLFWSSGNTLNTNTDDTATGAQWTTAAATDGGFVLHNNAGTSEGRILQYNANSGQERFACYKGTQKDAVLFVQDNSTPVVTVAAPTLPEVCTFEDSYTVVITNNEEGATLSYSTDGENWTQGSSLTITETTTVYAKATKNGVDSRTVSATYTKVEPASDVTTLAQANGLEDGANFTFKGDAVVTYHSGKYLYVRDASGYGLIYYSTAPAETFDNGVVLSQNWSARKTTYKGLPEFENPANVSASGVSNSALAAVQTIQASQMADMLNAYVKIEHVKSISGTTATLTDGTTVTLFNRFSVEIPEFTDQDCSMTGIVNIFNGALQFYFIESDYNSSVTPVGGNTYTLVTDVADLNDGDKIILVNNEAAKAMGAARTSNFGAVSVTLNDNIVVTDSANVITLEAQGDNWALKANEGYLYAASSTANQLKAKAEVDSNAIAIITIDGAASIIFQGSNARNNLRYNKGSVLFSCYASGQEPVYIYKANSEGVQVAAPVFAPAHNTTFFTNELNVNITCETEGAQIYYSLDNENFQPYTALTITETCTVYAYAQIGENKSNTVSAKYYKGIHVNNLEQANGLNNNDKFMYDGEAIVTYQWKNENNGYYSTWIKDATGSGLIYGKQVPVLAQGTVLADGWDATFKHYNSIPEYQYPNNVEASEDVVTVTPTEYATLDTTNVNEYIIMKAQALIAQEGDTTGLNFVNADGLVFYNQFGVELPTFEEGKAYDVIGIATIYKHEPEVYIISVTEVPAGKKGDVNNDGNINVADVTALINHVLSQDYTDSDTFNSWNADINEDGSWTVADVTALINLVLSQTH